MAAAPPSDTPPVQLKIKVIRASELLDPSQKGTLRNLSRLINNSFAVHGHPTDDGEVPPRALFLRKRLIHDEDLSTEMGPEALTAICTDETLQDSNVNGDTPTIQQQTEPHGKIVATASLKLWKGKVVDLARSMQDVVKTQAQPATQVALSDQDLSRAQQTLSKPTADKTSDSWNWEVKLCSSSNDPRYRSRGLIIQCVDALIAEIKRQQAEMREASDPKGGLPIKLWSTSLEGTGSTDYWMRRGFVKVGEAEVAPKGTWESTRDITICTLAKMVE